MTKSKQSCRRTSILKGQILWGRTYSDQTPRCIAPDVFTSSSWCTKDALYMSHCLSWNTSAWCRSRYMPHLLSVSKCLPTQIKEDVCLASRSNIVFAAALTELPYMGPPGLDYSSWWKAKVMTASSYLKYVVFRYCQWISGALLDPTVLLDTRFKRHAL